jgi:hypothetical protein
MATNDEPTIAVPVRSLRVMMTALGEFAAMLAEIISMHEQAAQPPASKKPTRRKGRS